MNSFLGGLIVFWEYVPTKLRGYHPKVGGLVDEFSKGLELHGKNDDYNKPTK